ncbi:MAG: hypothetical protein IT287_01460, partial [Bdellovibrionaceae bacterium]|nr:hypothetical protein [Pseudobdellovibrionaceae bacterium]
MKHNLLLIGAALILQLSATAQAKNTATFLKETNDTLAKETVSVQRAEWVQTNFITEDSTIIA